jgi:TRAP-type uncharacterized transport system fused permease subunit
MDMGKTVTAEGIRPLDEPVAITLEPASIKGISLPDNFMAWVIWIIALSMALFHMYTALTGSLLALYQRAIHFGFAGCLVFLIHP